MVLSGPLVLQFVHAPDGWGGRETNLAGTSKVNRSDGDRVDGITGAASPSCARDSRPGPGTARSSVRRVVTWLPERSVDAVRAALRTVAPQLAERTITLHDGWVDTGNPLWSRSSAFVDDRWVVKFAWTESAATKLVQEAAVIDALGGVAGGPPVAPLLARSDNPALFVAPLQTGRPLAFEITGGLETSVKDWIGTQLAGALAGLHAPPSLAAVSTAGIAPPSPTPQADTDSLRQRFVPLLDRSQGALVSRWCDWADEVLEARAEAVLLHGDFHGYNVVFDDDWRVVRVLDFEECSAGDPHYDFRYLPAQEPTVHLLRSTVSAYEQVTDRSVDLSRVMAWHLRTVCGDALWRTEARVSLPGGGTPSQWIDELGDRFRVLGIGPRAR